MASGTGWNGTRLPGASSAAARHCVTADGHGAAGEAARFRRVTRDSGSSLARLYADPGHVQRLAVDNDAFGLTLGQRPEADLTDALARSVHPKFEKGEGDMVTLQAWGQRDTFGDRLNPQEAAARHGHGEGAASGGADSQLEQIAVASDIARRPTLRNLPG